MSHSETLAESGNRRVRLVIDEDCQDPRKDADVTCGAVTVPGSRYVDVPEAGPLADAWARLMRDYGGHHRGRYSLSEGVEIFERYVRAVHHGVAVFDTPTDGADVAWYVTPDMMRAAGFRPEEITPERMADVVNAERAEYRAWAEGDCWGWILEERAPWQLVRFPGTDREEHTEGEDWTPVDSAWGYIGRDYAEQEARAQLED